MLTFAVRLALGKKVPVLCLFIAFLVFFLSQFVGDFPTVPAFVVLQRKKRYTRPNGPGGSHR
jgi:hypothetical protein